MLTCCSGRMKTALKSAPGDVPLNRGQSSDTKMTAPKPEAAAMSHGARRETASTDITAHVPSIDTPTRNANVAIPD